jgi:dual specificity protein kinase YAK1
MEEPQPTIDADDYIISDKLGSGVFSTVFTGTQKCTNSTVAFKRIKNDPKFLREAYREITILNRMNNRSNHCVFYYGSTKIDNSLYLVFEKLDMNLYLFQKNYSYCLNMSNVIHISYQILDALCFIHEYIIHCDLKHENIMIDSETYHVKVIDFGSSRYIDKPKPSTDYIVSRYYRPPEVVFGLPYSTKLDIWSFGCIVSELLIGSPIFSGRSQRDLIFKIASYIGIPEKPSYENSIHYLKYFKPDCKNKCTVNERFVHSMKTFGKPYEKYNEHNLKILLFENCIKNSNLQGKEYEIKFMCNMITDILVYDVDKRPSADDLIHYRIFLEYKLAL